MQPCPLYYKRWTISYDDDDDNDENTAVFPGYLQHYVPCNNNSRTSLQCANNTLLGIINITLPLTQTVFTDKTASTTII